MSTDINGLLSTFKTNMMNNGVAVESGDKFKSLIDKIATMVEEGGNKGIQMVNSDITSANSNLPTASSTSYEVGKWVVYNVTFDEPLNFTPTIVLLNCFGNKDEYLKGYNITINSSISFDSTTATTSNVFLDRQYVKIYINNITNTGFTVNLYPHDSTYDTINSSWYSNASYVAIGVGEEDTTLRDSLASILEDEGVSVTEEDDMASLITKVDEEFDRKIDVKSGSYISPITMTEDIRKITITHNLGKTPSFISIYIPYTSLYYLYGGYENYLQATTTRAMNYIIDSRVYYDADHRFIVLADSNRYMHAYITDITNTSFSFAMCCGKEGSGYEIHLDSFDWVVM